MYLGIILYFMSSTILYSVHALGHELRWSQVLHIIRHSWLIILTLYLEYRGNGESRNRVVVRFGQASRVATGIRRTVVSWA